MPGPAAGALDALPVQALLLQGGRFPSCRKWKDSVRSKLCRASHTPSLCHKHPWSTADSCVLSPELPVPGTPLCVRPRLCPQGPPCQQLSGRNKATLGPAKELLVPRILVLGPQWPWVAGEMKVCLPCTHSPIRLGHPPVHRWLALKVSAGGLHQDSPLPPQFHHHLQAPSSGLQGQASCKGGWEVWRSTWLWGVPL